MKRRKKREVAQLQVAVMVISASDVAERRRRRQPQRVQKRKMGGGTRGYLHVSGVCKKGMCVLWLFRSFASRPEQAVSHCELAHIEGVRKRPRTRLAPRQCCTTTLFFLPPAGRTMICFRARTHTAKRALPMRNARSRRLCKAAQADTHWLIQNGPTSCGQASTCPSASQ